MSRPQVRFVAPSAYPLGGVATWLDRLLPDLRALGWPARVVLTDGAHHDAGAYEAAHPAIAPALRVRAATGTREGRVQALARALACDGAALVVSVNVPDALLAARRIKAAGGAARAVMSVHGLEPDLLRDARRLAPLLDGVVCTNRLAQAALAGILEPARLLYAPYGTGIADLPPRTQRDRAVLTIGFAGRFERFQKRVHDLAPIAAALARRGIAAHWLLAGDGPDGGDVHALGAAGSGNVDLLGQVDAAQMGPRFYDRCDVLLVPSAWETGPIVIWEAMARGIAVVSARYVGSGREGALRDGENCLLFPVGDVDAAARCLEQCTSPRLRAGLGARAHALVAERYSPQASARAWADALEAVAALPPRLGDEPAGPPSGRLDRWLGAGLAERARRAARRRHRPADAGAEWPHTLEHVPRDDPDHWERLRALDAGEPQPAGARATADDPGAPRAVTR